MLEDNLISAYFIRLFRLDLPHRETMTEYLDFILPKIRQSGNHHLGFEDLYMNGKYWLEINDDDNAHESILHMFGNEESPEPAGHHYRGQKNYKYSIDGNIINGIWAKMGNRTMLIKALNYEMFELVFLNQDFFILRKHGNHHGPKYMFLANENKITRQYEWYDALGRRRDKVKLEWRDIMEMLFDIYRYNIFFVASTIGVIFILMVLAFFSI